MAVAGFRQTFLSPSPTRRSPSPFSKTPRLWTSNLLFQTLTPRALNPDIHPRHRKDRTAWTVDPGPRRWCMQCYVRHRPRVWCARRRGACS
eukprot:2157418-Rhodomonas_salina.4